MGYKIYFGHPINTYDTELENRLLQRISVVFPRWFIENPNEEYHQDGYQFWKKFYGNGMDYYYKEVLPSCSAGIFLSFRDGKWGTGVFAEAEFLHNRGYSIFQIDIEGRVRKINFLDNTQALSVDETRKRIRTESGETVPY
ncbi:MAG: hypothetical protein Q7S43_02835 [bacterium]|nr:hypothetical protein [bacterium]MDO8496365.1 hypothetical protein [bacterium]